MNILTEQQGKVLDFIAEFIKTNHFPPSRTEIADHLGFKSANAADEHVKGLVRKGYISVRRGTARGITIINNHIGETAEKVPEGWQLVPKEATDEMITAGDAYLDGLSMLHDAYEAMLAAAPKPECEA